MDYPFENLGPERFQQFCQALLADEFPRVQCFPVGQPDGGRDAVSLYLDDLGDRFTVFQVKFVRNPFGEVDAHKWLVERMEGELEKAKRLINQGASEYFLLTNIPGTAHLETGSIDRLNKVASEMLGIPFQCWWRDDINRRLDRLWSLKWAYPELMTGPDFLRWIGEIGFSEQKERRSASIRAFLRHQYSQDEEVRFKQVELQNKLLDLFVEVPIGFRDQGEHSKLIRRFYAHLHRTSGKEFTAEPVAGEAVGPQWIQLDDRLTWESETEGEFEAATLLLSEAAQTALPRTVVEGAPGQGKSTIAQYVCQVHRMRLLRETEALASVPKVHRDTPIRFPIKIDLRDFATWLAKKNPFNADNPNDIPNNWLKSLESFLAALISNQSGGTEFSADDLIAVLRISSVLIVFDGLDEVADISRRKDVVDEIVKGTTRIKENAASLQVVVTSRPAAFANSPGMPQEHYLYLQLLSLNRQMIMQYADRWVRARKLDARESIEFRRVLKEKLDQPHLRDLARNPMQLAILLSLLLTRGSSLPDKRTALYDFYMDLFFSREAEKSPIVRNHRELLINIHRYLAWVLHSESETGNSRASITQERLLHVVRDYLRREGHDESLADELFTGMVERVVALVSRVQGTFEFEVQPLREYFAACHLYYTAPQSSPGKEKPGSKPDRFDAIARNFYWLNVTRFYAGCYSKGELPSLVERLAELKHDEGFRSTSYPRILAATLLSDWVFTQNPKSIQQLTELVLDGVGFRYLVTQVNPRRRRAGPPDAIVLPPKCGREELIERGFVILRNQPPEDFQNDVIEVLKAHRESASDVFSKWKEYFNSSRTHAEKIYWLSCGSRLGAIAEISEQELDTLVGATFSNEYLVTLMLSSGRVDYLEKSADLFEEGVSHILDEVAFHNEDSKPKSALDLLSYAVDPHRYAVAFRQKHPVPLSEVYARNFGRSILDPKIAARTDSYPSHSLCLELSRISISLSERTGREWATTIEPWDHLVESARSLFGDRWAFSGLAVASSGIRSSSERCQGFGDLLDHSKSLCRRARFARLRSGSASWWATQLSSATEGNDILLVLLSFTIWATTPTLIGTLDSLDDVLTKLPDWSWKKLFLAIRWLRFLVRLDDSQEGNVVNIAQLPEKISLRTGYIIGIRADQHTRFELFKKYFEKSDSKELSSLEFSNREALDWERLRSAAWEPNLDVIRRCYEAGALSHYLSHRRPHGETIPARISEAIMAAPDKYPGSLVRIAEESSRSDLAKTFVPVSEVATRQRWFL